MKYVLCLFVALIGFNLNAAETKIAAPDAHVSDAQHNVEQALLTKAEQAILDRLNAVPIHVSSYPSGMIGHVVHHLAIGMGE